MKKLTLILLMTLGLMSNKTFGQSSESVIVGTIASQTKGVSYIAELSYKTQNLDTVYTLSYENKGNPKIIDYNSISFHGNRTMLNSFYGNILMSLSSGTTYVSFFIGEHEINITKKTIEGNPNPAAQVCIQTGSGGFYLNKMQLNFLFGK